MTTRKYTFQYLPTEDEMFDPEWLLLKPDGTATNIAIQDGSHCGDPYVVQRYEFEGPLLTGMHCLGRFSDLASAKTHAVQSYEKLTKRADRQ